MDTGIVVRTVIRMVLAGSVATWLGSRGLDSNGINMLGDLLGSGVMVVYGLFELWIGRRRNAQIKLATAVIDQMPAYAVQKIVVTAAAVQASVPDVTATAVQASVPDVITQVIQAANETKK